MIECIIANLIISLASIFIRDSILNIGLYQTLSIRLILGGLILLVLNRKEVPYMNKEYLMTFCKLTVFSIILQFMSWNMAPMVSASEYAFITSSSIIFIPIFIMLGLLENRMRRTTDKIGVIIVVMGLFIMMFPKKSDINFNVYYIVLLMYVLLGIYYSILMQRICKTDVGKLYQGFCFCVSGIVMGFLHGFKYTVSIDSKFMLRMGFIILGGTVIYQTLVVYYMRKLDIKIINMVNLLNPVFASMWGYLILKDVPSVKTLIGGVFILLGLYLCYKPRHFVHAQ